MLRLMFFLLVIVHPILMCANVGLFCCYEGIRRELKCEAHINRTWPDFKINSNVKVATLLDLDKNCKIELNVNRFKELKFLTTVISAPQCGGSLCPIFANFSHITVEGCVTKSTAQPISTLSPPLSTDSSRNLNAAHCYKVETLICLTIFSFLIGCIVCWCAIRWCRPAYCRCCCNRNRNSRHSSVLEPPTDIEMNLYGILP